MLSSPFDNLANLQTNNHSHLLDVIDELREQGLSNFLPLPQLIVCGDQSSGKSSVLEAISGVPFPKKDSLCTRFATEVVLRRALSDEGIRASVSILPGADRSENDQLNLRNFSKALPDVVELPEAIERAKEAMGLGSQGSNAFSTDVLRLEVTGPRMPQLTIVDLPGLIHSENKFQTAQDVELVSKLVQSYMSQKRSIILAVVSAKNDHANQIVLKRAREEDPSGERTLGIITKPDTLFPGSESEKAYMSLARNLDVSFKLGWHVVRNLDSNEISEHRGREFVEEDFFKSSNWRMIGVSLLGSGSLRKKLSTVLFNQITYELPKLMEDIEACRADCEGDLNRLGRDRKTEMEQRMFLTELNQKANDICKAGCNGIYDDPLFRISHDSSTTTRASRLRAIIQNASMEFSGKLKAEGARWEICEKPDFTKNQITREEALSRVERLISQSRGRELPGTFNPMLISELFHEYSTPWEAIAQEYVFSVWQHAKTFVGLVIQKFADESVCDLLLRLSLYPEMDAMLRAANEALRQLFTEMDRHAMTFNDRFIENAERDSKKKQREHIERKLLSCFTARPEMTAKDVPWVLEQITKDVQGRMDRSASVSVLEKMEAFYQVAVEKFADNVPLIIVEAFIVQPVLDLFQPVKVWSMSASLVQQIAGESPEMEAYREKLTSKLAILRKGEAICKRYAAHVNDQKRESPIPTPTDSVGGAPEPDRSNKKERKKKKSKPEANYSFGLPTVTEPEVKDRAVEASVDLPVRQPIYKSFDHEAVPEPGLEPELELATEPAPESVNVGEFSDLGQPKPYVSKKDRKKLERMRQAEREAAQRLADDEGESQPVAAQPVDHGFDTWS